MLSISWNNLWTNRNHAANSKIEKKQYPISKPKSIKIKYFRTQITSNFVFTDTGASGSRYFSSRCDSGFKHHGFCGLIQSKLIPNKSENHILNNYWKWFSFFAASYNTDSNPRHLALRTIIFLCSFEFCL